MTSPRLLRVLLIDDSPDDAFLLTRELRRGGFDVDVDRVETREELIDALARGGWDLILADYHIPGLPVEELMSVLRDHEEDVPFLVVSGTVDEDTAVEVMTAGAHDFLSKDRLGRLVPAVERELRDAAIRRRQAGTQRDLEASRTRFRDFAEHIRDVFWVSDPEKVSIEYVSPAYEEVWGRSRAALYADPTEWLDAVHPQDRDRVRDALELQIRGEYELRYRIVRPDGDIRWVWDRAFPVRGPEGGVDRIVGVAEDVTEQVTLEQQLLHSQKMEAVGRLAGGVAHDFNNLLTVIGGRADLLSSDLGADSVLQEDVEEIQRAVRQASSLTRRLLAFSKRQILDLQEVSLEAIVRDMQGMARRLIGEEVELEVDLCSEPSRVRADPGQLEQVILNLAVNAREALGPASGTIRISTDRSSSAFEPIRRGSGGDEAEVAYCTLSVTDDGSGITDEVLNRIFEPFFTTKSQGTGLGLSTVFGIVDQLGGRIDVVSAPGEGTTFTVHLPRVIGSERKSDRDDAGAVPAS